MLCCMLFIIVAMLHYAVLLGIIRRNIGKSKKERKPKEDIERRLLKLDSIALRVFIGMKVLTLSTYFYVTCMNR